MLQNPLDKLRKGDIVTCIDTGDETLYNSPLIKGGVYKISSALWNSGFHYLVSLEGTSGSLYSTHRFILGELTPLEKLVYDVD